MRIPCKHAYFDRTTCFVSTQATYTEEGSISSASKVQDTINTLAAAAAVEAKHSNSSEASSISSNSSTSASTSIAGDQRKTRLDGQVVQILEHRGRLAVYPLLNQVPGVGDEENDPPRRPAPAESTPQMGVEGRNPTRRKLVTGGWEDRPARTPTDKPTKTFYTVRKTDEIRHAKLEGRVYADSRVKLSRGHIPVVIRTEYGV